MKDRRWKIEDGRSKMEDRRWKIEDGRSKMEGGDSLLPSIFDLPSSIVVGPSLVDLFECH